MKWSIRLRALTLLHYRGCVACLTLLLGCAPFETQTGHSTGLARLLQKPPLESASTNSNPASTTGNEQDGGVEPVEQAAHSARSNEPSEKQPIPISFDSVLRLASDRNGQIRLARERIWQADTEKELADKHWLPELYTGVSYYRHEGGIQNEDGRLTHSSFGSLFAGLEIGGRLDLRDVAFQRIEAERRLWQQKGELSKLTSENLLDAASTYIDLLAARTGEAITSKLILDLQALLDKATKIAAVEPASRVEIARIQTEISSQKQSRRKSIEQARAASAKLAYLLGMGQESVLVPMEPAFTPLALVDDTAPVHELLAKALNTGPGVREVQRILSVLEEARQKSAGIGRFLPTLEIRMAEGAFGAGPGSRSTWDNRWDLGLQVRWSLSEYLTAKERQRIAQSKLNQLQLSFAELKSKLAAGVEEAYEAIGSARDQMRDGGEMIDHAQETLKWSNYRFTELELQKRAAPSEVLQALRALAGAKLSYLGAVRDHNRAQVRLLFLVGSIPSDCSAPGSSRPADPTRSD
jgi:outer membrane protein TolC